jgi:hypothetical protein
MVLKGRLVTAVSESMKEVRAFDEIITLIFPFNLKDCSDRIIQNGGRNRGTRTASIRYNDEHTILPAKIGSTYCTLKN